MLFYADKSILRAVIWLVLLMHASYSNHIEYNETPTLPVLNGPPSWVVRSASKKTADPELDTDSGIVE